MCFVLSGRRYLLIIIDVLVVTLKQKTELSDIFEAAPDTSDFASEAAQSAFSLAAAFQALPHPVVTSRMRNDTRGGGEQNDMVFDGNDDDSGTSEGSDEYDEFFGGASASRAAAVTNSKSDGAEKIGDIKDGVSGMNSGDVHMQGEGEVDVSAMGGFIPDEVDVSAMGGIIPDEISSPKNLPEQREGAEESAEGTKKFNFTSVALDDDFNDVSASAVGTNVTGAVGKVSTQGDSTQQLSDKGGVPKVVPKIRDVLQELVAPRQDFVANVDEFGEVDDIPQARAHDGEAEDDDVDTFGVSREDRAGVADVKVAKEYEEAAKDNVGREKDKIVSEKRPIDLSDSEDEEKAVVFDGDDDSGVENEGRKRVAVPGDVPSGGMFEVPQSEEANVWLGDEELEQIIEDFVDEEDAQGTILFGSFFFCFFANE